LYFCVKIEIAALINDNLRLMNIEERIKAFVGLGDFIIQNTSDLQDIIKKSYQYNTWFTRENTSKALRNITREFLSKDKLETWLSHYDIAPAPANKTIAIVAAGNIPMVAFHDILCVLISGNKLMLKLSEKDKYLLPFLLDKLIEIEPRYGDKILIKDRLENFDAIIATGSNNTARHFEHYFGKYKNIIRRNRNSIAVLTGNESEKDIEQLGYDIFDFFGLGCRNVSKIFVPKGFDMMQLKRGLMKHEGVNQHNAYMNNLDYQRTLYLMNQISMLDIDFVNIVENKSMHSPISCLFYEYYDSLDEVKEFIAREKENIQCIAGHTSIENIIPLGKTQEPGLMDYADNVDTMKFILNV
jgi:hypothetical protein